MISWNIDTKISFSPFITIGENPFEIKPNWHLIINEIDYPILKEAAICYSDVIKEYVKKNPNVDHYSVNLNIKDFTYNNSIQQFFLWQPIEINDENFQIIQALSKRLKIGLLTQMLSVYDFLDSKADTLLTNDCPYLRHNEETIEGIFQGNQAKLENLEKEDPIQLSKQLFNYCISRPNKIESVIDFICQRDFLCPAFINYIFKKFSSDCDFIQEVSFIIERLLSLEKVSFADLCKLKSSNEIPFNIIHYSINDKKRFKSILNEGKRKFHDQIDIEKLSDNNWELQRYLSEKGINPLEIAVAIRNDDLQTLKSICKNPNLIINPSPYERCTFINKDVTLLQYAAFFGSIKCFSYLQLCKAKINEDDNLYQYAVCGGNAQIMNSCENLNKPYEETLNAAIVYHRDSICSNYFSNDFNTLQKCIEFDQVQVFLNFLKSNDSTKPNEYKNASLNEILFEVVRQNNYPFLELMLKISDIDLNAVDNNSNMTLIQLATVHGSLECIKMISAISQKSAKRLKMVDSDLYKRVINSRALKESLLKSSRSPKSPKTSNFEEAEVKVGRIASKYLRNLVNKIVDFNERNQFYNNATLLHFAAKHNRPELIDYFLNPPFELDINAEDVYGNTPLLTAAANGSKAAVSELLKRRSINKNAKNRHDYTALHVACESGSSEIVDFLIKNGLDVNARGYFNNTPLYFAAKAGSIDSVISLLKRKDVDVNAICDAGNTALHMSCLQNQTKIVELLLKKKGIVVDVKNSQGKLPVELTTNKNIVELINNFKQT